MRFITGLAAFFLSSFQISAVEPPEGFTAIFNGKDLTGWEGSDTYWSVEDGAFTGVTDGSLKMNRFITWKGGTVRNFELRVKVRVTPGGNSGLQYRGQERPDLGEWVVTGYQCDVVAARPDYNGMLYEERGRRILAQTGQKVLIDDDGQPWVWGTMPLKEYAPGEWHDFRVVVEGNHHRHWIDGHQTVEVKDLDPQGRALEGVIAVQVHVGPAMKVEYKDFFLKHLPDDLPLKTAEENPIPANAYLVRPQRRLPKDWTAPVRGEKWKDLSDLFRRAKKPGEPQSQRGEFTSGGRAMKGIFLHAPNEIVFPPVMFPKAGDGIRSIQLRTAIGFKDGTGFTEARSDGCRFVVLANGEEVFSRDYAKQEWLPEYIDLTNFAGREVTLTLKTEANKNTAADWACFARPSLWVTGEVDGVNALLRTSAKIESPWRIEDLERERAKPQRTFFHSERNHIAVMDEHLDLATALKNSGVRSPVPLAPRIVAGEGAHPDNHTIVKVLDEYGATAAQFLAFPPDVRGGVRVESVAGKIAATPLANEQAPVIAFFDKTGTPLGRISPSLKPPFVMAAVGDDLAVSSAGGGGIQIFSLDGELRKSFPGKTGTTSMASRGKMLLVYNEKERVLTEIQIETGESSERVLDMLPPGRAVFPSAFDDEALWAGGPQALRSHVYEIRADGSHIGRDVGSEENQFWIALPKEWEAEFGPFKGKAEAKHIRLASYGHIRIDSLSPRYRNPDAEIWAGAPFLATLKQRGLTKPLDKQPPRMWNPTFTHRQFTSPFRPWAEEKDSVTGQNRWLQQSPTGGMDGYGNWDNSGFVSSTYAPGAEAMQALYTEPLRAFMHVWSPLYRAQPWRVPSIEPNHEFEIVTAVDAGIGDYNPHMIRGFFDWLSRQYGEDRAFWLARFGAEFDRFFDAPRDLARGKWDRYDVENPFVLAWIEYNRHVVNRTLALTFREALAAGVPPEVIRCHQIPDRYAVAPPLRGGIARITPVDYAMTAGVGFGFTKFGVNHDKENNIINATRTSGFDSFVMGEFQPLSTDPDIAAKELRYVFRNGARAIHPLYWGKQHTGGESNPEDHRKNETVYNAIQALISEDPPRPGQAGGIGQVRAYRDRDERRAFNIVSIGSGQDHRGLIKSIRADGRMEGTVYVIPFHQNIRVGKLKVEGNKITAGGPISPGSQISILADAPKGVTVSVIRGEAELQDLRAQLSGKNVRYTLRLPERMDELSLRLDSLGDFRVSEATLQSPECADIHTGRHTGIPNRGGVTFDVLE